MRGKEKKMTTKRKALLAILGFAGAVLCALACNLWTENPALLVLVGKIFCFAFVYFYISAAVDIYKMHKR